MAKNMIKLRFEDYKDKAGFPSIMVFSPFAEDGSNVQISINGMARDLIKESLYNEVNLLVFPAGMGVINGKGRDIFINFNK